MKEEPYIVINGNSISQSMSMTIRVAIEHFASDLNENGLGEDRHGKRMTDAYLQNISYIRKLIFGDALQSKDDQ